MRNLKLFISFLMLILLCLRAGTSSYYYAQESIKSIEYDPGVLIYIIGPFAGFGLGVYDLERFAQGYLPESGEYALGNSLLIVGLLNICYGISGLASNIFALLLIFSGAALARFQYIFGIIAISSGVLTVLLFIENLRGVDIGGRISSIQAAERIDFETYVWYGCIVCLGLLPFFSPKKTNQ